MREWIEAFNALPLAGLMLVIALGFTLGRLSLRGISTGPGGATLSQTVSVTPGKRYTFGFWIVKATSLGSGARDMPFTVTWSDNNGGSGSLYNVPSSGPMYYVYQVFQDGVIEPLGDQLTIELSVSYNGGGDPPEKHHRDRLADFGLFNGFRRGEAILLHEGHVAADEKRRQAEEAETLMEDRRDSAKGCEGRGKGGDHEPGAAAYPLHQDSRRHRENGSPHDEHGHRQGGPGGVRRERTADDPPEKDDDRGP